MVAMDSREAVKDRLDRIHQCSPVPVIQSLRASGLAG